MTSQSLSLFQHVMMQWERLHPYNAGQAMQLTLPLPPDVACEAWNGMLHDLKMGRGKYAGGRFWHLPPDARQTLLAPPSADALPDFIAGELNRQFEMQADVPYLPFRPFWVASGSGTCIGVFYHHWVADSVSIRLLLREWFYRCFHPDRARRSAMEFLGPERMGSPAGWVRAAVDLMRWNASSKRVRRGPAVVAPDLSVGFGYRRLPDGIARELHKAAKQHHAKVGDLLVHALVNAVQQTMPPPRACRPDLAIGTIRDTRVFDQPPDFARFGMRLGFAKVVCPAAVVADRQQLLATIAAEHRHHREAVGRQANALEMRLGLAVGRLLSPASLGEFYRKRLPLSAGLSNVDLRQSWVAHHHPKEIAEFFRISPTGPTLPIVVTPTTLGEQTNLAFTWRKQTFTAQRAEAFIDAFTASLKSWVA